LSLPVWFRAAGETLWHNGVTQSVSTNGAVIRADGPAPSSEPVIVVIVLPSVAGCLVGRGRVVRTVEPCAQRAVATFSIAVRRYRIRSKAVLSRLGL